MIDIPERNPDDYETLHQLKLNNRNINCQGHNINNQALQNNQTN